MKLSILLYRFRTLLRSGAVRSQAPASLADDDLVARATPLALHATGLPIRDIVLVTALASVLFFAGLGSRDLWNPNEPIYGRAVVEMEQRDDWVVPTVNGQVFAEKPILYFWLARITSEVAGETDEWSLRVPSAVAGVASVVLTAILVAPYAGRRRALIAAAVMATQYQVFWAARSVQMDVLVLLFTVGAVLPLTRMLDFRWSPTKAWLLAGLSLGLGFAAKGPVSVVLPGLVIVAYTLYRRRFAELWTPHLALGTAVALAVASPWYLLLWFQGQSDFLVEVLFRQNFTRFVDAWDHRQPWWYYLKYIWLDYAPWAWFLPAVALIHRSTDQDARSRSLNVLCWLWIATILLFFSLSESKRAPYIVPIAPAVAILVSDLVSRWLDARRLQFTSARRIALAVVCLLAILKLAGGSYLLFSELDIPSSLSGPAVALACLLGVGGMLLLATLKWPTRLPAPAALAATTVAVFLLAAVWILPKVDRVKSARSFANEMNQIVDAENGQLASVGLWRWRADYVFYSEREIPNLTTPEEINEHWRHARRPFLLLESRQGAEGIQPPPDAVVVLEEEIGGRTAQLVRRAVEASDSVSAAGS